MMRQRKRIRCMAAGILAASLLSCMMLPALAESVTLNNEDNQESLRLQVVQDEDELIEIDEYDVPYGLPESPACQTHYILLAAALALGIVYSSTLLNDRKSTRKLQKELKEAEHA